MKISKKVLVAFGLIGGIVLFNYFGLIDFITIETLKANRQLLSQLVKERYLPAVMSYVAFYILAVALCFPSASIITLAGGFLFGPPLGALFSVIGATLGASVAFMLVRYLFAESMLKSYEHHMRRFNKAMENDGISFLLFVRLVALFPFFLINILIALTPVPFKTFFWTTAIGIVPGTFVYAFAGGQLHRIESARDILSPSVLLAFLFLGLLALLPSLLKRIKLLS